MSDKIYYYTFAYLAYGVDQENTPMHERDYLVCMTDVVLQGETMQVCNEAIQKIAIQARKNGFAVCQAPQPTFVKRTKTEILTFLEKEKKAIKRAEQDAKNAKAAAKKAEAAAKKKAEEKK